MDHLNQEQKNAIQLKAYRRSYVFAFLGYLTAVVLGWIVDQPLDYQGIFAVTLVMMIAVNYSTQFMEKKKHKNKEA
ncbi:hypothetical protein [Alteribacter aurantiacus]|uniref:hypothetical protein n=1 Tax=Alteribacter aurantiacus TaxID=254410 RepID=UPI000426AF95|nr:hypothetical protein [Alteribacter aurantiacus]